MTCGDGVTGGDGQLARTRPLAEMVRQAGQNLKLICNMKHDLPIYLSSCVDYSDYSNYSARLGGGGGDVWVGRGGETYDLKPTFKKIRKLKSVCLEIGPEGSDYVT